MEKRIKKSKCLTNKNIPQHLRRVFAEIETNPLKLLVTNIPPNVILEEMRSYFFTLISQTKPEWKLKGRHPLKSVYLGERKKFLVIELDKKDAYRLCEKFQGLPYKNYNLMIRKPRGFFRRLYDPE